jgi:hypothetical protein
VFATCPQRLCYCHAAFGWDSCDKGGTWYKTIEGKIPDIKVHISNLLVTVGLNPRRKMP